VNPMLVPLIGFLRGDTIGLVVLVHDHQTVAELAWVVQQAASVRVAPRHSASVFRGDVKLDPDATVAGAGLSALDRIDVVQEQEPEEA
jgi:Toluene-4-monooxygenase system protein B (TmoB)